MAVAPEIPASPYWMGHTALRALADEQAALERRARRHGLTGDERRALVNIERTRREIYALGRARIWADHERNVSALDVVRKQANELEADGLGLRCLNPEDLLAIRTTWPDWSIGDDIVLSESPAAQRPPERDGPPTPADVESNDPAAAAGPESPDPNV